MPRYLLLLYGDANSESGGHPPPEVAKQLQTFNAELKSSGAFLDGGGIHGTSKAARVTSSGPGKEPTVTQGPFSFSFKGPEGKSGASSRPVAGYWIIKASNLQEAVGWVKKAPLGGSHIEVREVFPGH